MTKNIGISGTPEEIKIIGTLLELEGFAKGGCREQECVYLVTYNSKMYDSFDTKDTSCGILINKKEFKASEFDKAYQYLFDKELFSTEYFIKNTRKCISTPTFEEFIKIISLYNSNIPLKTFTENEINTTFYPYSNGYGDIEYANKKKDAIIPASFVLQFKSEKMSKDKKIIGYNLKDNLHIDGTKQEFLKGVATMGCIWDQLSHPTVKEINKAMSNPNVQRHFIAAKVIDLWFTPIYEQDQVVLNIGNPKQRVLINKDGVTCESATMSLQALSKLNDKIDNFSCQGAWSMNISEIKIGCSKFSVEEFDQVWEASKKFMS